MSRVGNIEQRRLEKEAAGETIPDAVEQKRQFERTVRRIITDTSQIRAGLIEIDLDELSKAHGAAIVALKWIVDLRDPALSREIIVAARELLTEARERDRLQVEMAGSLEEKTTSHGGLSEDEYRRLKKAAGTRLS